MYRGVVPKVAPASSAFSALKTLTHSYGFLYFLLQMKQGGTDWGGEKAWGLFTGDLEFEVGSWEWGREGEPWQSHSLPMLLAAGEP